MTFNSNCDGADEILNNATNATTFDEKAAVLSAWRNLPIDAKTLTKKQFARALGVAIKDLDAKRGGHADVGESLVKSHVPWPHPVDGADLLDGISTLLTSYIVLPLHAADTIALWVVVTHCLDGLDFAPYLNIKSPERRCGKSRLLELLQLVVAKALATIGVTNAALFRVIAIAGPTVIIDEADRLFREKGNEDLVATINAGNTRGAKVTRCVGDNFDVQQFECFAPYVIAGIRDLPDTITDRSLVIAMRRKTKTETVRRKGRHTKSEATALGEQAARWAADNLAVVTAAVADAPRPEWLDDRACDVWEALFAVAALAGGSWRERAMAAAKVLSAGRDADTDTIGPMLLADLRAIFRDDRDQRENLTSEFILARLIAMPERPWPAWRRGAGLSDRDLAKQLRPYGIRSTTVRSGNDRGKGYRRCDLAPAWDAYAGEDVEEERQGEAAFTPSASERDSVTTAKNKGFSAYPERDTPGTVTGLHTDQVTVFAELSRCHAQKDDGGFL